MIAAFPRAGAARGMGLAEVRQGARWLGAALLSLALAAPAAAAAPQRIASLNLCTDQLLLMLVPRARIASVSDWAVRPESSYMAAAAQGLPLNRGSAEAVLPLHPDLIIAGHFNDPSMIHLLRKLGYRVELVTVPGNVGEARDYMRHFGALVGEEAAAEQLLADMDAHLRRIAARVAALPRMSAAVYAPNGVTVGRGTLLDDILKRAGLTNIAAPGLAGYGRLSLEQLLMAQPQMLVLDVTADADGGGSIAHTYLQHPALAAVARHATVVTMPPRLSECVGPMTVAAIELLVARR
jgi:iron complex transport system substrate-binding protein